MEVERADSSGNVAVRTVLHLHPHLAPIKVAVVPQEPLQSELCEVAQQLSSELREAGVYGVLCLLYVRGGILI